MDEHVYIVIDVANCINAINHEDLPEAWAYASLCSTKVFTDVHPSTRADKILQINTLLLAIDQTGHYSYTQQFSLQYF